MKTWKRHGFVPPTEYRDDYFFKKNREGKENDDIKEKMLVSYNNTYYNEDNAFSSKCRSFPPWDRKPKGVRSTRITLAPLITCAVASLK